MSDGLTRARELVHLLRQNLPTSISVAAMGVREKTPYNLLSVRESLAWRTEELGRAACDLLDKGDLAAVMVLTRAVAESAAFIFRLKELLETRSQRSALELQETVLKMIAGWKNDKAMPDAINIATLIKHMEKKIPGAQESYNRLSEFAHLNWSGVSGLFSDIDREKYLTNFGKNARMAAIARQVSGNLLTASLEIFCYSYNKISEEMPKYLSELTPL